MATALWFDWALSLMKKTLKLLWATLLAVALLFTFCTRAFAQETNPPSSILTSPIIDFLSQGSNWMVAPYATYSTEDSKIGGGVAALYKVTDFVATGLRLDYIGSKFWMPSCQFQLQAPFVLLGKLTVTPFTVAGLATPIGGGGNNNGSAIGIFGAGASVAINKKISIVADYEKWTDIPGHQIRFGFLYHF